MSDSQKTIDPVTISQSISEWLENQLDKEAFRWIRSTVKQLKSGGEDWEFFSSFSAVPRHTGKAPLSLSEKEQQKAVQLRPGWTPSRWSVDQLGRTYIVLSIAERSKDEFLEKLEKAFISSDLGEAVALYQSLPVLPYPDELQARAAEGIRSNMTSVFNAVALQNPYPADYFDDGAWNQVVLKALFVGSPLYQIQGIDRRANKTLAHMLIEYAHERWSAGRPVSPELWRPVGPFIDKDSIDDIKKVLTHPEEINREAAMLALSQSTDDEARKLLNNHQELLAKVQEKGITWEDIGKRFEN
ncbi:MAG: EboA family metabolite traffic protein [Balneolaceae bacterium]